MAPRPGVQPRGSPRTPSPPSTTTSPRQAVRHAVGFFLQAEAHTALVGRSLHAREVRDWVHELAAAEALAVSDGWIEEFAVAGAPEHAAAQLRALLDAGADTVGLWLFLANRFTDVLPRVAHDVVPLVGS